MMAASTGETAAPLLSRERIIAKPGFNRWLVPPAALCIHLCIGMAYGFSVFWKPLQGALLGADGKPLAECSAGATTFGEKSLGTLNALFATDCNWSQFDLGWMYIRALESLGLATVKKVAPKPRFAQAKAAADLETLHAVIANRYDVLSRYTKSIQRTYADELERLKHWSPRDAEVLRSLKRALLRGQALAGAESAKLGEALKKSRALATVIAMRDELVALWERSSASKEQLLRQLQDWCHKAENSGVPPLVEFSHRLRSYA